jgi:hypothetical protein
MIARQQANQGPAMIGYWEKLHHPDLPGVGYIRGDVDILVFKSSQAFNVDLGWKFKERKERYYLGRECSFVVVVAGSGEETTTAHTRLIAQLLTVQYQE